MKNKTLNKIKKYCGDCSAWSGTDCTRNPYAQGCLKEKIEEMAKDLYGHICGKVKCEDCKYHGDSEILSKYCDNYLRAKHLVEKGYRKIPKGAVVLTIPFGQELHFLYSREHYGNPQPPCIYSTKEWIFNVRSDGETWFTVAGRGICFYGEYLHQLGKTVFLSKDEAECKLQEKLKCQ